MANWLLDYIEMTEYIPLEFRDQTFSMRELDLKVSIAMSQLEVNIKEFFAKIETLTPVEKQEQYEALVRNCDEVAQVANAKVKIADRLHDLVDKSMRLLYQGLEKLKEDLIEGDKASIVEDIERRSQELDEQLRLEEETILQRLQKIRDSRSSTNHHNHYHFKRSHGNGTTSNLRQSNNHASHKSNHHGNHINSNHNHLVYNNNSHQRQRHNSASSQTIAPSESNSTNSLIGAEHKKRERKRSAMSVFNRNSKSNNASANQINFLTSPTTPDYLANLSSSNSNSTNDLSTGAGDTGCLTLKSLASAKKSGFSNGTDFPVKARQPILTAFDAAHAVSPTTMNSDKLVLFPNNSNGDNLNNSNNFIRENSKQLYQSQASNHSISPVQVAVNTSSQNNITINNNNNNNNNNGNRFNLDGQHLARGQLGAGGPFSALSLSSRHDPIMLAASQAIHATQNMAPGRRTSSLKASYAAINSGRLQHPNQGNHSIFDQANMIATGEVYCKCRGAIHDPNMIACDNSKCKYEWFHYECVGITTPPAGEWFCDDCKVLPRAVLEQETASSSKYSQSRQTPTIAPVAASFPTNNLFN